MNSKPTYVFTPDEEGPIVSKYSLGHRFWMMRNDTPVMLEVSRLSIAMSRSADGTVKSAVTYGIRLAGSTSDLHSWTTGAHDGAINGMAVTTKEALKDLVFG